MITCIDHPATIDLSLLAPTLGVSDAASLDNVPLPSHDHLLTTRNGDQPEWWNVIVIPVTSAKGLATVEQAKDYATVKALETVPGSGIGVTGAPEVPTNAYLWFQTLPGAGPATPGPVSSELRGHPAVAARWWAGPPSTTAPATTRSTAPVTSPPSARPPATAR